MNEALQKVAERDSAGIPRNVEKWDNGKSVVQLEERVCHIEGEIDMWMSVIGMLEFHVKESVGVMAVVDQQDGPDGTWPSRRLDKDLLQGLCSMQWDRPQRGRLKIVVGRISDHLTCRQSPERLLGAEVTDYTKTSQILMHMGWGK